MIWAIFLRIDVRWTIVSCLLGIAITAVETVELEIIEEATVSLWQRSPAKLQHNCSINCEQQRSMSSFQSRNRHRTEEPDGQ